MIHLCNHWLCLLLNRQYLLGSLNLILSLRSWNLSRRHLEYVLIEGIWFSYWLWRLFNASRFSLVLFIERLKIWLGWSWRWILWFFLKLVQWLSRRTSFIHFGGRNAIFAWGRTANFVVWIIEFLSLEIWTINLVLFWQLPCYFLLGSIYLCPLGSN